MTILFIVSCVVFLASLAGIIVMVVRKFPVLSSLNLHEMSGARETEVKTALLEQRLRREFFASLAKFKERLTPAFAFLRKLFRQIKVWAAALEERYQKTLAEEHARVSPGAAAKSTNELIGEAAALLDKERYADAEAALIKVIAAEPKSIPAFRLLARVYTLKKEYGHVRELDEFLLKLDPHQADVYADLGTALVALGESALALDAVEKAVALEEGNPKYLDQLLELAILQKRRSLALQTLQLLEEVNPENEKISVFATRIQELPRES